MSYKLGNGYPVKPGPPSTPPPGIKPTISDQSYEAQLPRTKRPGSRKR